MSTTQHDNSASGNPEHVADLIVRYYDEALSPDELALLREALLQSATARDWFVRWGMQAQVLNESLAPQYREEQEQDPASDASALSAFPDSEQSYAQLLQELAQLEAQVEPATVRLDVQDSDTLSKRVARPSVLPDRRDVALAAGYVFRNAVMTKAAAMTALAALVLIALLVLAPWQGLLTPSTNPAAPETAQVPDVVETKTPVATLTAQHNATWADSSAEGASAPGSNPRTGDTLAAGQRLNLTQGFAEITTNQGARAILQAPATIELIDHDNALRLVTGKLVGICETDSSKGFLVRTPHTDITDLGTHFGVDATQTWATEVHVFDGKVAVGRLDAPADTESTLLLAGESARATGITDAIRSIDHDIDRFAAMLPPTIPLPSTGQGLAAGEIDPRWTVIAVDGQELDTSPPVRVFDEPETRGHGPRDAQWIGLKTHGEDSVLGQGQTVVLQTQFWIPSTADTDACALQLRFIADYRLLSLVVNDQTIDVPANRLHSKMSEMVVSEHLIHGANSIRFEIQDDARPRGVNYVGLRASWQLHTRNAKP